MSGSVRQRGTARHDATRRRGRSRCPGLALLGTALFACGLLAGNCRAAAATPAGAAPPFAPVLPGYHLVFPRDRGAHPRFRIEWWYLTGWLETARHQPLGFETVFFRTRLALAQNNPSAFTPRELLIAHVALSDPRRGRLWQAQRIRRAGLGLAEALTGDTDVWLGGWRLQRQGRHYHVQARTDRFALDLSAAVTEPPLLEGPQGFSRKGPGALSASYYYSEPQLHVTGTVERDGRVEKVSGLAWLDHEWTSQYLDPQAQGWDWIGINLNGGGALMTFRMRARHGGAALYAAATLRGPHGRVRRFGPDAVQFTPQRHWRSPRTGIVYPVSWLVRVGDQHYRIEPLMDDQEFNGRLTSGAVYWEGAVRAFQGGRLVGRGYLELTGYGRRLVMQPGTNAP